MSPATPLLIERIILHPTLHLLRFRLSEGDAFEWKAGQHAVFLVTDEHGQVHERPMSIANGPGSRDIEFLVTNIGEGLGTRFFRSLEVGSRVSVLGPRGSFKLVPMARPSYFVSSHSGLAPMRAMVHELLDQGCAHPARLIFSVPMLAPNELSKAFDQWCVRYPLFSFRAFETGEFDRAFSLMQSELEAIPSEGVDVYYCGGKTFMEDLGEFVRRKGFRSSSIHTDMY